MSQMRAQEKAIDDAAERVVDGDYESGIVDEEDDHDGIASHRTESTTLATEKRRFEIEDKAFWDVYASLSEKHLNLTAEA